MKIKKNISIFEKNKKESLGLRGTIIKEIKNELYGKINESDQNIIKFHGIYQQDDRDRRLERYKKKLDRIYSFMIRLRIPGGLLNSKQWINIYNIAKKNTTGIIKITTRQTIQLYGLIKKTIKPTIKNFNIEKLDSIATCGDVNRNVICSSHKHLSSAYEKIYFFSKKISSLLLPKSRAYYEIWLDEKKISKNVEKDPLYKEYYLPRKFKIAIAIPPNNDVDVFTNDIGLIAIIENNKLKGFNILVGGGLSTIHGNLNTYPRLGTLIGFIKYEKIFKLIYEIVTIQRDYGNRSNRKLARFKYTIDKYGISWFKKKLKNRTGFNLEKPKYYFFFERKDYYGWYKDWKGFWNYGMFIENGRILDKKNFLLKSVLFQIAKTKKCQFRLTCNQNLILSKINNEDKIKIKNILDLYNISSYIKKISYIRKNSMACVALNTCPLALAEGQRYLPSLISKIEKILLKYNLLKEEIIIRMTGCPNGCARPYVAEIGLIGVSYGRYNLYLGSDKQGTRLNKIYKKNLEENSILVEIDKLLNFFKKKRINKENFGDFVIRKKIVF
jgi:sulfite reductase (NADPH) hemoprotein beta-component